MSDDLREIYDSLDQLPRATLKRTLIKAKLGNGQGVVKVANRPGFVYARLELGSGKETVTHVYAPNVRHVNDNPVKVEINEHGFYQTIGVDAVAGQAFWNGYGTGYGGPHGDSHGLYGDDRLWVDMRQVRLFLVHPTAPPSLSVDMEPGLYRNAAGEWAVFIGGTIDLTSFMPTALNEQRLIVVGMDKANEATTVITGTATVYNNYQPETVPFTAADVVSLLNAADSDFVPKMAVRLAYGQTQIQQWDHFYDCRTLSTELGIVPLELGGGGIDLSGIQGLLFYNEGTAYAIHCVGDQVTAPTVNDDETSTPHSFGVLSLWAMSVTAGAAEDAVYMCVDATDGAAVWLRLDGSGGGSMTSFDILDDYATTNTITDGNTLRIEGVGGIEAVFSDTDHLQIQLASTAVTPGSYTLSNITVDARGRITAAANGSLAADSVSNTVLANMAALTVKARVSNSSGDPSDLAASADNQFLVRRSSALTFGTLVSADLTTPLTTPPAIGGTTPAAGTFTTLTTSGNVLISGAGAEFFITAPAGNFRNTRYQTTVSGTPTNRFNIALNNTAESGSNVGSDLAIRAFDDSGTFLIQPLLITRSTGLASFGAGVYVTGDIELDGALNHDGSTVGFYGATPVTLSSVTGSRSSGAALDSLLQVLSDRLGLISDDTTA